MQPPNRGRPKQPGRGSEPARWTGIEIALIILSVVMIAYPLAAGTARLIAPPLAPAQELTPDPAAPPPPTDTPDPAFEPPATDTAVPPPTDTAAPPTDTAAPAASETPESPEQVGGTATSRPATPTSTTDPSTPTPSNTVPAGDTPTPTETTPAGDTPTPTNTTDPNISPTPTNTTDPNISPTPTLTQAPTTGVRVFKVASVAEAAVGQSFSYSVSVITDSATDQQVQLSDGVDGNLEVLSASSGSGSCTTGQTVSCNLTIRADNPASVTIQVRVRAGVAVGTNIDNSASAGSASSATVNVRVIGGAAGTPSPSPTGPTLTPSPSPTGPTLTPSPSPTGPTATAVTPVVITPTRTNTPRPPEPPPEPRPPDPDEDRRPSSTEVPPAPPAPPTPIPGVPTEPPTPESIIIFDPNQPVVRPTAAVRPTRVPLPPTNTPSSLIPIPTGSAQPTSGTSGPSGPAGGGGTDIFFRMASDWGSAYPGQQVNFTLVVRNTRAAAAAGANDLRNLTVRSALPGNLELLGARADRGSDPVVTGNEVSYSLPLLQPGEGAEITIATRIRADVTVGTLLVAQGQLTYEGLAQTAFSNIVSVQVVGNAQAPTAPPAGTVVAQATTGTTPAYPPPSTGTPARTATAGATAAPTASSQAPAATARPTVVPPRPPAPLPDTSTGVPLLGIALLGGTLLTRTWRIHRSKTRL